MSARTKTYQKLTLHSFSYHTCLSNFVSTLIDALIHLYHHGILHNNINAANILVQLDSGNALLLGFSHACHESNGYTISSFLLPKFGEECCLPFDVKEGRVPVSFQSDVFCFGFTFLWRIRLRCKVTETVCKYINRLGHDCTKDKPNERLSMDGLRTAAVYLKQLSYTGNKV